MSPALRQNTPEQVNINMTRSRKTLSPSQLENKRAHDREAQRANRRRVKERIIQLEQQIEEKRGHLGSSRVYHELLRRNLLLEEQVARLRSILTTSSTAKLSTLGSSPGSVLEGLGLDDYSSSVDCSSHDTCHYFVPHCSVSDVTTRLQPCDSTTAKAYHSLPISLDGIDVGSSTAMWKPPSTITYHIPETPGARIFHNVHNGLLPDCNVDTLTTKSGGIMRRHRDAGRSESYKFQMQAVDGGWDLDKMEMRHYQDEACFGEIAPTLQPLSAYHPGHNMDSHELARFHDPKLAYN
ncbi:uncharacterized protein MAM_00354 [Metarhizium album ARSEF 1941]|uniref:BZIP domain-containing protein n=1 Tax=Metarhizium album (strain ARSEF 1941) TaxID=1081103 RepID=A0A0B2X6I3_METAS|nr:uncharacterized protein MAM_00354 [Metarhizium album ARSEF 1941]KHO01353.1 hypothetical protein MAM_00354 [Metarhizium album ARSEF 1941]